jgi:hypothetical protein
VCCRHVAMAGGSGRGGGDEDEDADGEYHERSREGRRRPVGLVPASEWAMGRKGVRGRTDRPN